MYLTWCFLMCLITGSVPKLISRIDAPYSVPAGDKVTLRCPFELTEGEDTNDVLVKWWQQRAANDSNDMKVIYQRTPKLSSHVHPWLMDDHENDTIILEAAQPNNSHVYVCEVNIGMQEARHAHTLVVYTPGSMPQLNVTRLENDTLLAECGVENASPMPDLVIRLNGINVADTVNDSLSAGGEGGTWSNSVTAIVPVPDDARFECELYYNDVNISHPQFVAMVEYSRTVGVYVVRQSLSEQMTPTTRNVTEIPAPQEDGCVKLGATILMPATLVLMQLLCILQEYLLFK